MDASLPARGGRKKQQREQPEQHQHHRLKLWRKYQVQKSTALGLLFAGVNLSLNIRHVDVTDIDIGDGWRTSSMKWWAELYKFPPDFDLFPIADDDKARHGDAVARVTTKAGNGVTKSIASIEIVNPSASYEKQKGSTLTDHEDQMAKMRSTKWQLKRESKTPWKEAWLKRHYTLTASSSSSHSSASREQNYHWKGSKSIVGHLEDFNPNCHGNLKFMDREGRILAAWKQQRDSKVLGSIHIFEEAEGILPPEIIVTSCLIVVLVEKINGITWFGG